MLILSNLSLLLIFAYAGPAQAQITITPDCQVKKTPMGPGAPVQYEIKGSDTITGLPANASVTVEVTFWKKIANASFQIGTSPSITGLTDGGGSITIDSGWVTLPVNTLATGDQVYCKMTTTHTGGGGVAVVTGPISSPVTTAP